jgi:hypothetical protein
MACKIGKKTKKMNVTKKHMTNSSRTSQFPTINRTRTLILKKKSK